MQTRVPRLRLTLAAVLAPMLVATVTGLVLMWPYSGPAKTDELGLPAVLYDATVISSRTAPCLQSQPDDDFRCTLTKAHLTSGRGVDSNVTFESTEGPGVVTLTRGDRIVLGFSPDSPEGLEYYFADYQRTGSLFVLTVIFAVLVVVLGRIKGVAALAGMAVTLLILVKFVLPAILQGEDPLLVATVGAATIMFIALYVAHGVNVRTTIAILGTLAALALTGLLALIFVEVTRLTGFSSEEAIFLQISADQVNLKGLVLAGVIIGSLGVLDDVTITQASAVWEIHLANPSYKARQLYRSAVRIGRDHIASTVNTLLLAYAGASLPLLILFNLSGSKLSDVINAEIVAEEVVRTLVGSIGLVASVPITTALAAFAVSRMIKP